jgi:CheY-like chemotaxis protein
MSEIESPEDNAKTIVKLSAQVVHDITTPLAIIQILAKTLETYLPVVLSAYQQQKEQDVKTINIPEEQYNLLETSAIRIKAASRQINDAAKDFWQKVDQQIDEADDEINTPQPLTPKSSISLEQSLRILIAEDDAIHQKIAFKLLSNRHQVDIAVNGQEAVEYCQRKIYDLVLIDLQMPVMDGQAAVVEIMQLTNSAPIIIGVTNRPLGSERKLLLQQGFCGFLEKPLNLNELTKLMEDLGLTNKKK